MIMLFFYVIKQYERAVVFKLGKITGQARGGRPARARRRDRGLIFTLPLIQRIDRVSRRIVTLPIQSQGIITKDNVSIDVSAVAYYGVEDPVRSVIAIENVAAATGQIAQTTLRAVVGPPHAR
jgi:regulator of protease activity HflC (stomatin/prohibitin superfamily)